MPSHAHVPGCARLNVARLNAFRLNYYEPLIGGSVGGVDRSGQMRIEGAAVEHVLNDAPDTAAVRVYGFTPTAGQTLAIYNGDRDVTHQIFGGRILQTTMLRESHTAHLATDLQGIDPTWLLNRRRVIQEYRNATAGAIVESLLYIYGPTNVQAVIEPGLPVIDAITFTNETLATCITAICERIGGYWYVDYGGVIHVFRNESTTATPVTDTQAHTSDDWSLSEDLSQVVTRVIARGAGVGVAVDMPAGSTELPLDLGDQENFYNIGGGLVEVAAQRLTYTGVRGLGAAGALVGTGNAPSVAPVPTPAAGSSHTVGATYQYAATFATASGRRCRDRWDRSRFRRSRSSRRSRRVPARVARAPIRRACCLPAARRFASCCRSGTSAGP